jgi:hypothetical protein
MKIVSINTGSPREVSHQERERGMGLSELSGLGAIIMLKLDLFNYSLVSIYSRK